MTVYIQENSAEKERTAPPDYRGHTYTAEPVVPPTAQGQEVCEESAQEQEETEKSTPVGAFLNKNGADCGAKGGKRSDLFGDLSLGGLLSRIPFLSSLAPPPRRCGEGERKHSEIWDFVLLGVAVLFLLNGKEDDVLPLLLLLLLWD